MRDSAVWPYFHGCLAFLHRHCSPQSPLSRPLGPFLHSKQQPSPWDCFIIPKLQLPAGALSRGPAFLSRGWYDSSKGCVILIPFRLPRISCFTLSLKCFSSDSENCPSVGIGCLLQFPYPLREGLVLVNTPVFPPSSFILPSFVWFYTFFSAGQVLLSTVSWCSACTSVSEGVFLIYQWR